MIRNVIKSAATAEDIAHGVGTITQNRGGQSFQLHKVDIALGLNSETELLGLNSSKYPRARVGNTEYEFINNQWQMREVFAPYPLVSGLELNERYNTVIKDGVIARYTGTLPYITTNSEDLSSPPWEIIINGNVNLEDRLVYEVVTTVDLPRLSGQIAQNSEQILTADNDILVLCKGSYSLADKSFLTRFRLNNDEFTQVGSPLDLGTGADCRAMARNKDYLYVFRGTEIDIIDCRGDNLTKVGFISRGDGFVQTCLMTSNGYLIAPVWGNTAIEVYEVNYPQIRLVSTYTTPNTGNASVFENGGKFWLINHDNLANQLASFFIDGDGVIQDFQSFTITQMVNCRYAAFAEGRLYTGSYSTGSGVEIDISGETPVFSRAVPNIPNPILIGRYIYGTMYTAGSAGSMVRYSIDTVVPELLDTEGLLYPHMTPNYTLGIVEGDEAPVPGSTPNDSPMGQRLRLVRNQRGTVFVGNKPLRVVPQPIPKPFYSRHLDNYVIGVPVGGVNLMRVTLAEEAPFANFRLSVKAWILDNQELPATTRDSYMEGYVNGYFSSSQWTFNNNDFVVTKRVGISDIAIKVGATNTTTKRLDVLAVAGVDLPNAQVVIEVTFESLAAYYAELIRTGLSVDAYVDSRISAKGNSIGGVAERTGGGVVEAGLVLRPLDSGTYECPDVTGMPDGIAFAVDVKAGLTPTLVVNAASSPKLKLQNGLEDTNVVFNTPGYYIVRYNKTTNRWEVTK